MSSKRGIGRYSLHFMQALAATERCSLSSLGGSPDVEGVPNVRLPFQQPLEDPFNKLLIKTSVLAADLDVYHILSPMEAPADAVTYDWRADPLPSGVKVVSTLFDVIPLLYQERYLADEATRAWYMEGVETYKHSDLVFAISENARHDAIRLLKVPPDKIVALPPCGADLVRYRDVVRPLRNKPYFLSVLGMDERKNVKGLLQAVRMLPLAIRKQYDFLIVCYMTSDERLTLQSDLYKLGIGECVYLLGYVDDEALASYYAYARALVFPSFYEGLGLPIIEAMSFGCPVIASNTSSLPELVQDSGLLFDPSDSGEMKAAIEQLSADNNVHADLRQRAQARALEFSWDAVARVALEEYDKLGSAARDRERTKVAIVGPWPPTQSGVADYSAELERHLRPHVDVLRVDDTTTRRLEEADVVFYEVGNSEYHDFVWPLLDSRPGIVEFHDIYLHGYWYHNSVVSRRDPQRYLAEMTYSHGDAGRRYAEQVLSGIVSPANDRFMVNRRAVDSATQIIVHNAWGLGALGKQGYGISVPVHVIPLACESEVLHKGTASDGVRGQRVVGVFGHIATTKSPFTILRALSVIREHGRKDVQVVFVGAMDPSLEAQFWETVKKLNLETVVTVTGYVAESAFETMFAQVDVVVNLRNVYLGESSASLMRAIAHAKPTIVTNVGAFGEIPDYAVRKVPADVDATVLGEHIVSLLDGPGRIALEEGTQRYAQEVSWDKIVRHYLTVIFLEQQKEGMRCLVEEADKFCNVDGGKARDLAKSWVDTVATTQPWRSLSRYVFAES